MESEPLEEQRDTDSDRNEIHRRFSAHAESYEQAARVQKEATVRLARSLDPWRESLPSGPVMEVGAGTGLFSRQLDGLFPNRELWFTDLSPRMVECTRQSLESDRRPGRERSFLVHNAERGWFDPNQIRPGVDVADDVSVRPAVDESPQMSWEDPGPWALITGSFVAQWFRDPSETIARLATGLAPGGLLLMAMPGADSFPEWKSRCRELGVTYTGNSLPDTERLVIQCTQGPFQVDFHEEPFTLTYGSSIDFFREMQHVGATTPLTGKRLRASDFRRLIREWDRSVGAAPVQVTWHLLFLAIRRDFG